jgi:hypothetical protein
MVAGWVAKATLVRADLLKVLVLETIWDPQKKQKVRRFWMVELWGGQARLEPYLHEGTFVCATGDFDFNQAPDGKVWLHLRSGDLVMGPKKQPKSARLEEGARDISPGKAPEPWDFGSEDQELHDAIDEA